MKYLKILLTLVITLSCLSACLAGLTLSTASEAEFEMEIPYGKPTVDGVVEEGEYLCTFTMDKTTAAAWVGEVGESFVVWHLAWDEGGLYYAGTINDSTPTWRDENGHWVGIDCLELAINPGRILKGPKAEGVFFSFGSMKDGSIVAYRHNFADGLVSDAITGANKGHVEGSDSYTMEVYIPWSLVQIKEKCTVGGKENVRLDATDWDPTVGAQLGLLPCAIDSLDEHGGNIIAYKFNGTDFIAKDFVVATLADAEGKVSTETEAPTEAPTEPVTETPTEETTAAPADSTTEPPSDSNSDTAATPDPKGCGATVALTALSLLPAAWIALRKREN